MSSAVPLPMLSDRRSFVIIIGVDPHKRTHTASALEPGTHRVLATLQIDATLAGYRQLARWAAQFEVRRWAVENARGLGRHLAQWLAARGEQVDDVPCTATARVRELSRGGRRKNDVIDAAAAASVAALAGDATPIPVEDLSTVLALLDERRANLAAHRTRLVNQLHALLRDLVPGGADTDLTATAAARVLAAVRPVGPVEAARKQLARDLVAEVREVDARLAKLSAQMSKTLAEHGSRLLEVDGIGPVVATRLLAVPAGPADSPPHRRSPTTPASPRSRWPAPSALGTGCPAAGTGSSTWRCTSPRSPRSACATASAAPTTTARSPRARPATRPCAASSAASPTTSGES